MATQRKNLDFQNKRSLGTEAAINESISESLNPEVKFAGGVYRVTPPTYADGQNAVNHYTADGKLKVDAVIETGEIEIGAVEIKDSTTDTRVVVTPTNQLKVFDNVANSLVPGPFDYISLGYTGTNLTSVVYKIGVASGTVVSTLTLAYTGSVLNSITKS